MKTDFSFKLVAAIVFAGVIVAFFSPQPAPSATAPGTAEVAPAAAQSE